jgi:hypothetical protein
MPERDLPPEFRHESNGSVAVPLELPLDDELATPTVPESDRPNPAEPREDPFLRRS